jgi:hypothetical protein
MFEASLIVRKGFEEFLKARAIISGPLGTVQRSGIAKIERCHTRHSTLETQNHFHRYDTCWLASWRGNSGLFLAVGSVPAVPCHGARPASHLLENLTA